MEIFNDFMELIKKNVYYCTVYSVHSKPNIVYTALHFYITYFSIINY